MNYNETIEFLFGQLPVFQNQGAGAYKPGLDTARKLSEAFGNAHTQFKSVHVAGTNGKGSTSHTLASVLIAQGYKVGLYTSPHILDFRERIRVNGEKIPREAVTDFVDRYLRMNLGLQPSFFELTTIMAFEYFAKEKVDYAVIETGLGGRLDTTNIIEPVLCVITNVSLEHTALLGDTIEQIAAEKGGIIKAGVPVVIGETYGAERGVFERIASEKGAPIVFAQDTPVECECKDDTYTYSLRQGEPTTVKADLQGTCQPKNANTALHALALLPVSEEAIERGMATVCASTGLVGRWTVVADKPTVVFDTGHNPGAWNYLAPQLCEISQRQKLHVVLGFSNDKDVESILRRLPRQAAYYFVTPSVARGREASTLVEIARPLGLDSRAYSTVEAGFKAAMAEAGSHDFVFVGGSNFVLSDILNDYNKYL